MKTVKVIIDHPRGYKIINEEDFDPKTDKLFEGGEDQNDLEALKVEAKELGIKFGANIGYETLKARVKKEKDK